MPLAATRIHEMSFFTGFGVSAVMYLALNALSPVPGKSRTFEEVDVSKYDADSVEEIDSGHGKRKGSMEKRGSMEKEA